MKKYVGKLPTGSIFVICSVNNDDSAHRVLNLSYKMFVGKHVSNISFPNVIVIDEAGLVGDKDMTNMESIFGPMKILILKALIPKSTLYNH